MANNGPASSTSTNSFSQPSGVIVVANDRPFVSSDNGQTLEVTGSNTLTIKSGLPDGFAVVVMPAVGVTVSIASDGQALLNGATTTLTRAQASNTLFAIQARASTSNSYAVSGS